MDGQTRRQYLKAMGIPLWIPRVAATPVADVADSASLDPASFGVNRSTPSNPVENELEAPPFDPEAYAAYTQFQATEAPIRPDFNALLDSPAVINPQANLDPAAAVNSLAQSNLAPDCSQLDWHSLQQTVRQCQLCALHKTRQQTVFGVGDQQARWMIVGEAPGAEEDKQGEPFVGRAGQLLNAMLTAIGLQREQIYIANILKCRPPNNRDPKPEEAALCRGYLERQIALVQPQLILVVGRIAAHNLLQVNTPLGRLRGQIHTLPHHTIPVVVTYHPAYLLRQPIDKRKAWQDLQLARQTVAPLMP